MTQFGAKLRNQHSILLWLVATSKDRKRDTLSRKFLLFYYLFYTFNIL